MRFKWKYADHCARAVRVARAYCFVLAGVSGIPGRTAGFAGLAWGTPIDAFESMRYVGTKVPVCRCTRRPAMRSYFGRARLSAIEYGFKDGRLAAVTLKVNSLLQYLLMKEEAFGRYGKGEEMAGRKDSYVWNGENTQIIRWSAISSDS